MYTPKRLTIRNIFSHKETTFLFEKGRIINVTGENLDEKDGMDSNGSGKSSLIPDGFWVALTGDTEREDITKKDIVRDKAGFGETELLFTNDVLKEELLIKRTINKTKSSTYEMYINDVPDKESSIDPNVFNKTLQEKLGVSFDLLKTFYVIRQENKREYSFFNMSDGNKKKLLFKFIDLTKLEEIIENIERDKSDISSVLSDVENLIRSKESLVLRLKNELEEEQGVVEEDYKLKFIEIDEKISEYSKELKEIELFIENEEKNYKKLSNDLKLEQSNLVDLTLIEDKYKKARKDIESTEDSMSNLKRRINKLRGEIEDAVSCPSCGNTFCIGDEIPLKDKEKAIKSMELELWESGIDLKRKKSNLEKLRNQRSVNEVVEGKIASIKSKLRKSNETIEGYKTDRRVNEKKIEGQKALKQDLKNQAMQIPNIQALTESLEKEEKRLKKLSKQKREVQREVEMYGSMLELMGNKGFKTYIVNKSLQYLEDMFNYYLKQFKIDYSIELSGVKELSSGEFRDKIEVWIVNPDGKKNRFARHSGGEKQRLIIASVISFINHINNNCEYGKGVDMLIVDEAFDDNMDELGKQKTMEILDKSNLTSVLISHKQDSYQRVIRYRVVKENRISKLIVD